MILVTGANGFVGSHVVRLLVKRGEDVRCLVRRGSNLVNLEEKGLKDNIELAYGDVRDPDSIRKAVSGAKTVYHLAAYVHLWYVKPKEVYDINWTGSKNLFQAALEEGVDKVIYTNTAAVLKGGTKENPSNEESVLSLDRMPGHYSRSKWLWVRETPKNIKRGPADRHRQFDDPGGRRRLQAHPSGKDDTRLSERQAPGLYRHRHKLHRCRGCRGRAPACRGEREDRGALYFRRSEEGGV